MSKVPSDELSFVAEPAEHFALEIPDMPELANYLHLYINGSGTALIGELQFTVERDYRNTGGSYVTTQFFQHYRKLALGTRVPMLGATYEVSELSNNALEALQVNGPNSPPVMVPNRKSILKLTRVADPDLLKEIAVAPESIIVPLDGGCGFAVIESGKRMSEEAGIDLRKIILAATTGQKTHASIHLEHNGKPTERPWIGTSDRSDIDLAEGDYVTLSRGFQFIVKKIVPADEKRKIVGWVEFAPIPPDGTTLKAEKPAEKRHAGGNVKPDPTGNSDVEKK